MIVTGDHLTERSLRYEYCHSEKRGKGISILEQRTYKYNNKE